MEEDQGKEPAGDAESQGGEALSPRSPEGESRADLEELLARSLRTARIILPFLSKRRIPLTPPNYKLWYAYFTEGPKELQETLDRLLAEGVVFTPERTQQVFEAFFTAEAHEARVRQVGWVGEKVQAAALELVKKTLLSCTQTMQSNQSLQGHLQEIKAAQSLEEVAGSLSAIISETDRLIRAHESFQATLNETAQEINRLQGELSRTEELARLDELTRLPNRRAFNERLAEEQSRCQRYQSPLSLVMLDVDDFKRVNDTYGHLVGDRLLALIAKTVKGVVRRTDFPARYGGEEFAVLCPETDLPAAAQGAERIRTLIDETEFTVRGSAIRPTVSGGVALYRPGEGALALVERADQSLYQAKSRGKNRICTEEHLSGVTG